MEKTIFFKEDFPVNEIGELLDETPEEWSTQYSEDWSLSAEWEDLSEVWKDETPEEWDDPINWSLVTEWEEDPPVDW